MSAAFTNHDDPACQLIVQALANSRRPVLWVLDENTPVNCIGQAAEFTELSLITNCIDQFRQACELGFVVSFNDFQLAATQVTPTIIIHRVSKHKALVHYLVNQAATLLPAGGELWLAGSKNEGTKTYAKKAANCFGGTIEIVKGKSGIQLFRISHPGSYTSLLPDDDYSDLRLATRDGDSAFYSKPGIYGWQKIDAGSQLLVKAMGETLFQVQRRLGRELRILDLGCGYGYLSVQASRTIAANITATDHNLAAVEACQHNFLHHDIKGSVVADDVAEKIKDRFDIVLCNPPFHAGFQVSNDLTEKFLAAAAKRLRRKGKAIFVVNQFIALPNKSTQYFQTCRELAAGAGFKVYILEH